MNAPRKFKWGLLLRKGEGKTGGNLGRPKEGEKEGELAKDMMGPVNAAPPPTGKNFQLWDM